MKTTTCEYCSKANLSEAGARAAARRMNAKPRKGGKGGRVARRAHAYACPYNQSWGPGARWHAGHLAANRVHAAAVRRRRLRDEDAGGGRSSAT